MRRGQEGHLLGRDGELVEHGYGPSKCLKEGRMPLRNPKTRFQVTPLLDPEG